MLVRLKVHMLQVVFCEMPNQLTKRQVEVGGESNKSQQELQVESTSVGQKLFPSMLMFSVCVCLSEWPISVVVDSTGDIGD